MHLSGICIAESAHFEIDDNQASKPAMKEEQIDPKPGIVDAKSLLPSQEREVVSQF
jgi:hypothetical protein